MRSVDGGRPYTGRLRAGQVVVGLLNDDKRPTGDAAAPNHDADAAVQSSNGSREALRASLAPMWRDAAHDAVTPGPTSLSTPTPTPRPARGSGPHDAQVSRGR